MTTPCDYRHRPVRGQSPALCDRSSGFVRRRNSLPTCDTVPSVPGIVAFVLVLAIATAWRRRKAQARLLAHQAGGTVEAPCALRYPERSGARWLHGRLNLTPDTAPVWVGNPDMITSRVELPTSRWTWEERRSGASEVMAIAPGIVVVRLSSGKATIELGLAPSDADALASYFSAPMGEAV
jgi:hypothetical protein